MEVVEVSALADGVNAEFRVAARPGGFRVQAGEFADAAGDANGSVTAVDHVRDVHRRHACSSRNTGEAGTTDAQLRFDQFGVHRRSQRAGLV